MVAVLKPPPMPVALKPVALPKSPVTHIQTGSPFSSSVQAHTSPPPSSPQTVPTESQASPATGVSPVQSVLMPPPIPSKTPPVVDVPEAPPEPLVAALLSAEAIEAVAVATDDDESVLDEVLSLEVLPLEVVLLEVLPLEVVPLEVLPLEVLMVVVTLLVSESPLPSPDLESEPQAMLSGRVRLTSNRETGDVCMGTPSGEERQDIGELAHSVVRST